jgi:hypothetical protein
MTAVAGAALSHVPQGGACAKRFYGETTPANSPDGALCPNPKFGGAASRGRTSDFRKLRRFACRQICSALKCMHRMRRSELRRPVRLFRYRITCANLAIIGYDFIHQYL